MWFKRLYLCGDGFTIVHLAHLGLNIPMLGSNPLISQTLQVPTKPFYLMVINPLSNLICNNQPFSRWWVWIILRCLTELDSPSSSRHVLAEWAQTTAHSGGHSSAQSQSLAASLISEPTHLLSPERQQLRSRPQRSFGHSTPLLPNQLLIINVLAGLGSIHSPFSTRNQYPRKPRSLVEVCRAHRLTLC